jgi:hypothetical protein
MSVSDVRFGTEYGEFRDHPLDTYGGRGTLDRCGANLYRDEVVTCCCTYGGRMYVAFLVNEASPTRINIVSTVDGVTWSSPTAQSFNGTVAKSIYPPCFTVYNKQLTMFWSAENDAVSTATVNTAGIDAANGPVGAKENVATWPSTKLVEGKWTTKIGNVTVYRSEQQWIITTTRDGEISIATNEDFDKRYNLTGQAPKARSAARCGVCIIPGFFGRNNSMPWTMVVVWRGHGADTSFGEAYVTLD